MKNMTRLLVVAGLVTTVSIVASDKGDSSTSGTGKYSAGHYTSRSYYGGIGFFESATYLYDALARPGLMARSCDECAWGTAIRIVPFGGKFTDKGARHMGEYFGLNHKSTLVATNEESPNVHGVLVSTGDLDISHFNMHAQTDQREIFKSTISINPKQTVYGVGLDWKQGFMFHDDNSVRFFFELNAPIIHMKNKMHFTEVVTTPTPPMDTTTIGLDGAKMVATMTDAFKQANWTYGKIDESHKMDKTRLADLEFKLGYNGVLTDCCTLANYVGVIFPTGNHARGHYMFEPVVGNGQHWGVSVGADMAYTLWCGDDSKFGFRVDADARYLFKKHQYRSFDLVGKEWSRYQEMYATLAAAQAAAVGGSAESAFTGTSGINLMTRKVDVTPRLHVNMNTALLYEGCSFVAEAGWTLYARQGEKIKPNWDLTGVNAPSLKAQRGFGFISKARTIRDWYGEQYAPLIVSGITGQSQDPLVPGGVNFMPWFAQGGTGYVATAVDPLTFVANTDAAPVIGTPATTVLNQTLQMTAFLMSDPDQTHTLYYAQYLAGAANYPELCIKLEDIDWNSGAAPAIVANTIYGTVGYNYDCGCYPMIFSVGGAYDFAYGNAAANRWTVFGQLGVSF
jgi:hypothetical protein